MKISLTDRILVNTWEDLESKAPASLRDSNMLGRVSKAPVYAIGPLVNASPINCVLEVLGFCHILPLVVFLSHCGWNSAGEYFQSGANDSLAFKRTAKNEC